jgi:hypothetical protein
MLVATEVGCGTLQQMSVRASQRHRLLLFDLQMPRVSLCSSLSTAAAHSNLDANLFKEAFIKAQQENEALFAS